MYLNKSLRELFISSDQAIVRSAKMKVRIGVTKEAFKKKIKLLNGKLNLELNKRLAKCSTAL